MYSCGQKTKFLITNRIFGTVKIIQKEKQYKFGGVGLIVNG